MKRLINGLAIGLLALLLMVVGLFVSRVIWLKTHHRYDSMPHGWFYGFFHARLHNFESSVTGDTPGFSMNLKGVTRSRWYWRKPNNFSYSSIELRTGLDPVNELVILDLPSLAYRRNDESGILTSQLLARWIAEENEKQVDAMLELQTAWIIGFLQRAHEGRLPHPRHHTYRNESLEIPIPDGLGVTLQHFRLGGGFWWLDAVFMIGIAAGTGWYVRRRKRKTAGEHEANLERGVSFTGSGQDSLSSIRVRSTVDSWT